MADEWYYGQDGDKEGPVDSRTLKKLAKSGVVRPSTKVWRDGMQEWVDARSIKGLFAKSGSKQAKDTQRSAQSTGDDEYSTFQSSLATGGKLAAAISGLSGFVADILTPLAPLNGYLAIIAGLCLVVFLVWWWKLAAEEQSNWSQNIPHQALVFSIYFLIAFGLWFGAARLSASPENGVIGGNIEVVAKVQVSVFGEAAAANDTDGEAEPPSTKFEESEPEVRQTKTAEDDGFESLFDGETLQGWDGDPKLWSVTDGAITGITNGDSTAKVNTFLVWTGGEVADFELKLQYKIINGNSGINYRSFRRDDSDKWRIGGYQADFEAGDTYSGMLFGEAFRGILAKRGLKTELTRINGEFKVNQVGEVGDSQEIQSNIKTEDWNDYHISAKGFHFVHRINGIVTAECTDNDEAQRRSSGLLALQLHAPNMMVQFRHIRIKHGTK